MPSNPEIVKKVIRLSLAGLVFVGMTQISGMDLRISQEVLFSLLVMSIFSLFFDNIWITIFFCWSMYLFIFYRFQIGQQYITNMFLGGMVYYMIKQSCKKEHINFFINILFWLVFANLALMFLQITGNDFVFKLRIDKTMVNNTDPAGFMGYKAAMATLMALALPLLYTRRNLLAKICAFGMLVPLYISRSSICVLAGGIVLLLCIWKDNRKLAILLSICVLITGGWYIKKIDNPETSMNMRVEQWKMTLHDATTHPLIGWGLDSYRNISKQKNFIYVQGQDGKKTVDGKLKVDQWDNPHNLIVSLFYEWGLLGVVCLFGLMRKYALQWQRSVKTANLQGLGLFLIALFIISMAQFPLWLARTACFIIPLTALYEVEAV